MTQNDLSFALTYFLEDPLALKQSVTAYRFLNKIGFNEGYLFGPKVCRSNLETPCINLVIWGKSIAIY